ncbi:MAG: DUF1549 and DUF1553 domain-containing protein [Planctomycetota bacterium]|nr:DUF1549 and DUF1553 domain-containing protein [Planctomycetota bacterium]MDA1250248.1 DUF1549 and DUF1553 domain-containing protein [Planctomycetota bacterium]
MTQTDWRLLNAPGHDARSCRWLIVFLAATALPILSCEALAGELSVTPSEVVLADAMSRQQILVETNGRDVTREASFRSLSPAVVTIDPTGLMTPLADGETEVAIEFGGETKRVAVRVSGMKNGRPVDFATDIVPILSRAGCNSGGCHGKAGGQNGFQLSLFGFDNDFDYDAIAKEGRGRRIFASSTSRSLLLAKATGASPHGGGSRFGLDSEAAQSMERWIELGAPASSPDSPRVVKLHVAPTERVLNRDGRQQLAVTAEYSDGSRRDVTRQSEFSSNLDPVAGVDEDGFVTATGQSGEAAIMVRYVGHVAVFQAIVPHGESLDSLPEFTANNYVDELAAEKWMKLGLQPSPLSDDATFLRRLTIDLCGRLPTVEETRAFIDDKSGSKRREVIDRLLDSPDYPAYFAMRWGAILRNSKLAGADQASYAFHNWIKDMIARNRPYDEFVRGVVAAAGEWQDAPAINWYWQTRDDQLHSVTADTAQVFLGIRLQCARCHHHPYERWGQEDYYGLAGFFTRLGRKSFGQPPPYFASSSVTTGEKNPLTGKVPEPKFLDGEYGKFTPEDDPRHALVDWMAKPDNPFFARVLVNRLWGHFMGRGLVNEVDDMRESNPPSNPKLLDALAKDFVDHKFDVRHIVRTLVNSRVYQLSSAPTEHNKDDRQNFARFYARRLIAEVLLDAVDQTTGTRTRFGNIADSARAVDLPHEGFGSYFLDTFDRPKRVSGCECERSSGATLAQVLLLANSDELENKLSSGDGRIAKLVADKKPIPEIIDELYLSAFARRPHDRERETSVKYVESQEDKRQALEDILWTIVNSKEFLFNH